MYVTILNHSLPWKLRKQKTLWPFRCFSIPIIIIVSVCERRNIENQHANVTSKTEFIEYCLQYEYSNFYLHWKHICWTGNWKYHELIRMSLFNSKWYFQLWFPKIWICAWWNHQFRFLRIIVHGSRRRVRDPPPLKKSNSVCDKGNDYPLCKSWLFSNLTFSC